MRKGEKELGMKDSRLWYFCKILYTCFSGKIFYKFFIQGFRFFFSKQPYFANNFVSLSENFGGFGLFFLWVSNLIFFCCICFRRRFMGLKVKVYFVGDRFGCWFYGFVCFIGDLGLVLCWRLILQEICIFVIVDFVLIWRLLCVLHVWLLRKCKKRNKNIDFLNFWARFAGKKMKNMINEKNTCFYFGQGLNMIF